MTEQTRRNILRYGIAIDLVILATGIGMLIPVTSLLLYVYAAAVALSAWRGGWKGALTAMLLSFVAIAAVFPELATGANLATFAAASIVAAAFVPWATKPRPIADVATQEPRASGPVAVPSPMPEAEDFAHQALARTTLAEVVPLQEQVQARAEAERIRLERELEARHVRELEERHARELEERVAREREAAQRELQERLAAERRAVEEEAARQRAEAEAERERLAAERRASEEVAAREREEAEQRAAAAEAARIVAEAEAARQRSEAEAERAEAEQRAAAAEAARVAAEAEAARQRGEAEAERQRLEAERARFDEELAARLTQERERLDADRLAVQEDMRRQLEVEREAMRADVEQQLAAERERIAREAAAAAPPIAEAAPVAKAAPPPPSKPSLIDTVTGWFRREERPRTVNLKTRRVSTNTTATRRLQQPQHETPSRSASSSATPAVKSARVLLIERRRATAETIAPKLKHRGVEIDVVERWVDAVDEIFRFKPHALFLDIEHPEFDRMHRTLTEKSSQLPIVLTGRSGSTPPNVRRSAFVGRPYDVDEVTRIAQLAQTSPEAMLAEQLIPRAQPRPAPAAMVAPPSLRTPVAAKPVARPQGSAYDQPVSAKPVTDDEYEITCFSCRAPFNAIDADWCSCLAKERSLVCTNCLACFCKAPPAYKEKFWVTAPPRLFERKTTEARRQGASLPANASRAEVKRPLVLTVEDDEEIQAIVQRVCANLDYGFIWATNGQDGLDLAREYRPNLILSDAFMPKLDGREMCRMLKEDPTFADTRMVIMTGLYTDTKYRSEAVKRFHVDDYISKPVAITDLINLLQKHLEGITGLPMQEDLHELHRQGVHGGDLLEQLEALDGTYEGGYEEVGESEAVQSDDMPLSDVLLNASVLVPAARPKSDGYDVCCFNCQQTFDATHAEWCSCVGRDNTLLCQHCGGCFCKAPAAYRERFWIDAPPSLFERKMIGSKRNLGARSNPAPAEVKRPLVLLVEDDENVQLIVRTVVSNMGYGFVVGADGQEGLTLAREYDPDMILSDAFMPKLDGREMCRLLKEDPNTARSKAVIMTGLYTDRKYRNEALDYFKVDDYVAKPLAVDDLIKLFKKHLPQEVTTAH
jgi:CheY-like chemotaxis protein